MHTLFVPQISFDSYFVVKGHSTGFLCLTQHLHCSISETHQWQTSTFQLAVLYHWNYFNSSNCFWILCWQQIVFRSLIRDTHTHTICKGSFYWIIGRFCISENLLAVQTGGIPRKSDSIFGYEKWCLWCSCFVCAPK